MAGQVAEAVSVEGADAPGCVILVCEHAANAFPDRWGDLGLSAAQRQAHISWDPGALGLARALAERLQATLVHATHSRLIYDLNRPPHAAAAMAAESEVHAIPGNRDLDPQERARRAEALYLPFHAAISRLVVQRLAEGRPPVLITVHSFTPVFHGRARAIEFGVIHDADDRLAQAIIARPTGLVTRLNEPYSAIDGVTHTLALHATPFGLRHAMLEIRSDLIADEASQEAVADRLASVLAAAASEITGGPC